ncbi:MAG: hypothetical protein MAG451_02846 [Anaerolineales bacterium]|nr:hypothetical protein [Anaerolineales bacterium]
MGKLQVSLDRFLTMSGGYVILDIKNRLEEMGMWGGRPPHAISSIWQGSGNNVENTRQ